MISGPRAGRPTAWRGLLAGILARALDAFVVPGPEILDASGLDAAGAGLRLVANPRHASVLLLVGEIPAELARAAAVAYAQIPRPRAILAVGTVSHAPLATADVCVEPNQAALVAGVADVRRRLATGAWTADPTPFQPVESTRGALPVQMHGMDHEDMAGMEKHHMSGGLMSMAMMTRDLPRSGDGMPMEWLEVPFGPLFPGLPGGLNLVLTLDGDTVARAEVRTGERKPDVLTMWQGPAHVFPDVLSTLDRLAPQAYRILAWRALEQAVGIVETTELEARRRITALETQRAASHLIWLSRFGFLLGDAWLVERASAFARRLGRTQDLTGMKELRNEVGAFLARSRRTPLLRQRLKGVGVFDSAQVGGMVGPVGRAMGQAADARTHDPAYQRLGFLPVLDHGGDARARCWLRIAEIEQSLNLVVAAATEVSASAPILTDGSGVGRATVETPRGAASLVVTLADGRITEVELSTPSSLHVHLVEHVAVNRELSDALIGVASLDLSPWELTQ